MEQPGYLFLVLFGTAGMITLIIAVIFLTLISQRRLLKEHYERVQLENHYKEVLLKSTIESREQERKRIAVALHDEVGVLLSTVRMTINFRLGKTLRLEDIASIKKDTLEVIDTSMETVRRISHEMSSKTLDQAGLAAAVRQVIGHINKTGNIHVAMEETGSPVRFLSKKELVVYRICQEMVNNTIKHAEATTLKIFFNWFTDHLELRLEDNGKGFVAPGMTDPDVGIGLRNMESQARAINADFKLESTPLKGTRLWLSVKFNNVDS